MAAKEMFDYLEDKLADYTAVHLDVSPKTLVIVPTKAQVVHQKDDGYVSALTIGSDHLFTASMSLESLSDSDHGDIIDLYMDSSKADYKRRTFYWDHPDDEHTYVARFLSDLTWEHSVDNGLLKRIYNIELLIEGRKAE